MRLILTINVIRILTLTGDKAEIFLAEYRCSDACLGTHGVISLANFYKKTLDCFWD